jgi:predicted membrane chloride channel (bestrophin family)
VASCQPVPLLWILQALFMACRTQLSYNRYWEGLTELQKLASKLTDVAVQVPVPLL